MKELKQCAVCERYTTTTHHLIFGRGRRPICDSDNIVMFLCDDCHTMGKYRLHDNPVSERLSKCYGQALWEKHKVANGISEEEAREQFIKKYGQSWIMEEV